MGEHTETACQTTRAQLQASVLLQALQPFARAYGGVSDLRDEMSVVLIGASHLRVADFRRAAEAIRTACPEVQNTEHTR